MLGSRPNLHKVSYLIHFKSYKYSFLSLTDEETEVQGDIGSEQ